VRLTILLIHFHARLDGFFGMDKQHPGVIVAYVFLTASFTNQCRHLLKEEGSRGALQSSGYVWMISPPTKARFTSVSLMPRSNMR
jgi:hypothetical protein